MGYDADRLSTFAALLSVFCVDPSTGGAEIVLARKSGGTIAAIQTGI
jgi:hypothetical protein